eukprot:comp65165_c0_seq1/m.47976 comp65165_c0_seq1/g.47976  ORF comp65165_c0_seq1/g.47976 comp65165_c0_seq1/m.47976 type:complete len:185 (-) comp65165_c0_seq1:343-897(-)
MEQLNSLRQSVSAGVRSVLQREEENPQDTAETGGLLSEMRQEVDQLCTLSKTQRMYGFGICFAVGLFVSVLSTVSLMFGNVKSFAVLYSLGNMLSFGSTFFLVGPAAHLKTMCVKDRAVASGVAIASIVMTLVAALWLRVGILALLFVLIQMGAMFWYGLSFIPYGRHMVAKVFNKCCDIEEDI